MTSKRKLKKEINEICTVLLAECFAKLIDSENCNEENVDSLLKSIMTMNDDYTRRISHPEPGMPATKYYKKLREDLVAHICDIVDQINN
jgi:hypothetical protein